MRKDRDIAQEQQCICTSWYVFGWIMVTLGLIALAGLFMGQW